MRQALWATVGAALLAGVGAALMGAGRTGTLAAIVAATVATGSGSVLTGWRGRRAPALASPRSLTDAADCPGGGLAGSSANPGPGPDDVVAPLGWMLRTRPYLRHGLNAQTAAQIARIVHDLAGCVAVAVTDRERVLAFVGAGGDHHRPGGPIATAVTQRAIASGRLQVVQRRREIGCGQGAACPLAAAVVAPLVVRGAVVGTLKLYAGREGEADRAKARLAAGIAEILAQQLELAELERQAALGARARLDALRAQINPHFLFNVLNTVISKVRTDPEQARQLLIRLADFFRYATRSSGQLVPFSEEFAFVRAYVQLERARFGDRLRVVYDVDPQILGVPVPVLSVQPLVENAVKHGIMPKSGPGTVTLRARTDLLAMRAYVEVRDDGVGTVPAALREALAGRAPARGIGLANIRERLAYLYGSRAGIAIDTQPGRGTRVRLSLPVVRGGEALGPVEATGSEGR